MALDRRVEALPVVHVLKTAATAWDAVANGKKRFEVRKNDRFFQRGDTVRLRKLAPAGSGVLYAQPEPEPLEFSIGWILQGPQYGLESGYIVFQLEAAPATKGSA